MVGERECSAAFLENAQRAYHRGMGVNGDGQSGTDRRRTDPRGTDQPSDVAAFVLAGGKSTRMGRDKSFIELHGETLLARALTLARSVASQVRIVGSGEKFAAYGEAVEDIFFDCGPLAGIHAALLSSTAEFNLIIAVDTPFVTEAFLRFLLVRGRESAEALATVPRVGGRWQPLCAVYRKPFAGFAEEALRAGRYKIGLLLESVPVRTTTEHEMQAAGFANDMFRNLNTPEDLCEQEQHTENLRAQE